MLAAAVPITRTLHVINLWLTSSISGSNRQSLTVHASSASGLRRRPLVVLDQSAGVEAAALGRVVVWVETAASVNVAGQSATVEAATMPAAALMEAAALGEAGTEQDAATVRAAARLQQGRLQQWMQQH